jgi:hypothetical protein
VTLRVLVSFVAIVSFVAPGTRVSGQALTQRGFVEGTARLFPQDAPNDRTRLVGDLVAREEIFLKPAPWIQFAGGVDLRANSHDQVDGRWTIDASDRGVKRPHLSVRRLSATLTHGPFTVDAGKQFIRWGKADIVTPTDRFAPRDFLNVVDGEFFAVTGVRGVALAGNETFEAVWVPRFTPSRIPLLDQRWTVLPANAAALPIANLPQSLPAGAETGLRWGHQGDGFEYSLSFFDGFNHLPNVEGFSLTYPPIRSYGADAAVPTRWFTIKGEAAYFTSPSPTTDEYVLYVIQLERQTGEWVVVAGYAGEAVTSQRAALPFAPDRGMTRSVVARAAYTIDTRRSVAFETAIRQNGKGVYSKVEFSQAHSAHWRATVTTVIIAGHPDDFLGQYRRNSHAAATLRYSF